MLVLLRKRGEGITIEAPDGARIHVAVIDTYPGKARVGVEAPQDWTINRNEIQAIVDRESRGSRRP